MKHESEHGREDKFARLSESANGELEAEGEEVVLGSHLIKWHFKVNEARGDIKLQTHRKKIISTRQK